MPKRPLRLKIRIPLYEAPRNSWRQAIHRAVAKAQDDTSVNYRRDDKLELSLQLYFTDARSAEIHDVDNRLKDCLDALQGRAGGTRTKAVRKLKPIIPNDRQVWRVTVEKSLAPKQARSGLGHLTIRRLGGGL